MLTFQLHRHEERVRALIRAHDASHVKVAEDRLGGRLRERRGRGPVGCVSVRWFVFESCLSHFGVILESGDG